MPVIHSEYPKLIDGVVYATEQDHIDSDNKDERARMLSELKDAGIDVDGRNFRGDASFGSLLAYYESKMSQIRGSKDGDSSNDG